MRTCSKSGCEELHTARGLCKKHYQDARREGEFGPRSADMRLDMSGKRCRCGLRLPCNDCLPLTATEFCFTRMVAEER